MLNAKMIGDKIAAARKKINIPQSQLAERLFISSQAVGKWERGESLPDIITLNRLGEILGVDLNYFSGETEAPSPKTNNHRDVEPSEKQKPAASRSEKEPRWDMSRGNWMDADFSGLKNLQEKFSSSNMQRCKFNGSELSGLLLKGNNINSCDFSGSDIGSSRIQRSHLANNKFNDCSLKETEFLGSHISACDFTRADFSGMTFKSGGFEKNTLAHTVWKHSSLIDTYLADLVFDGTIENCSFENCAFKRITFQRAVLINTFFKNKSLKQLKFVDCQADRMTYEFLKNGKADVSGITLLTS
ncbi:MAG: helix-turn-helix domain-containing protein [Bacteroidota bacterium]